jgi:hypothetical protein
VSLSSPVTTSKLGPASPFGSIPVVMLTSTNEDTPAMSALLWTG